MFNVPNIISLMRILLTPVLAVLLYLSSDLFTYIAIILFILLAASDFLDGMIARKFKIKTTFGAIIDQIADKIVIVTTIIVLISLQVINASTLIPAIIIIIREIAVSGMREFLAPLNKKIPVGIIGKYKTAVQLVAITWMIFSLEFDFNHYLLISSILLFWLAAILAIISAYKYYQAFIAIIKKIK